MAQEIKTRLIWRGSAYCRSLLVRGPGGAPIFYSQGQTIPEGVLTDELIEAFLDAGKLDRITVTTGESCSIATPQEVDIPETVIVDPIVIDAPRQPVQFSVEVGVMSASVDSGEDGIFGTSDDVINIRPVATSDPAPEEVNPKTYSIAEDVVTEKPSTDEVVPETAPTRKRKSSKRGKKTGKKSGKEK